MQVVDPGPSLAPLRIRVHDLTVRRGGSPVIRGVSLELTDGVVAVVGSNGSGKSTLLRAVATLLPPTGGEIFVMGADLGSRRGRAEARRQIGFLPQEPAFLDRFLVEESLAYAAWLHAIPHGVRAGAVRQTLEDLDLIDAATTPLAELSGGMRQRAYIGQAFVHRPPVLLLDEPTVGVDAEHRVELRRLISRLSTNRLVVLSTHLTEDIELLADQVVVLSNGRIVFKDSPAALEDLGRVSHRPDERPVERALRDLGLEG